MEEMKALELIKEGDNGAFEVIVEKYQKRLAAFVFKLTGSMDDVEDIVQIAFMKAYTGLKSGSTPQNMQSWLYKITYNATIDHVRKLKSAEELLKHEPQRVTKIPESVYELQKKVNIEMNNLPDIYRPVMHLRFSQGLKYEEISEVLGIPLNTVKSTVARGVKLLKEKFRSSINSGVIDELP